MDSNGINMQNRLVYIDDRPVSASFYPVTTMIGVADEYEERAIAIYNDRP